MGIRVDEVHPFLFQLLSYLARLFFSPNFYGVMNEWDGVEGIYVDLSIRIRIHLLVFGFD